MIDDTVPSFDFLAVGWKKVTAAFDGGRLGDRRIIRLIQKWMRAAVLEDAIVTVDDRGTGQGAMPETG